MSWLKGKNVMVTGCTSGIGQGIVRKIAMLEPKCIFLVARSQSKADAMQAELTATGIKSEILIGDQALASGNVAIAQKMLHMSQPLDALISNAGIWTALTDERTETAEGLEVHFATNYFSMVVLLKQLQPLIEKCKTRVLVTGSFTSMMDPAPQQTFPQGVCDFDNLQGEKGVFAMNSFAYAHSKLLQYMWLKKFAEVAGASGAIIGAFDPGQVHSSNDVYKAMEAMLGKGGMSCMMCVMGTRLPPAAAEIAVWALEDAQMNGKLLDCNIFGNPKKVDPVPLGTYHFSDTPFSKATFKHSSSIEDPAQVERLWNITEALYAKLVK